MSKSFVMIKRGDGAGATIVHGDHDTLRQAVHTDMWAGPYDDPDMPDDVVRILETVGNPDDPEWWGNAEPPTVSWSFEDGSLEIVEITQHHTREPKS